jgi:ATP-binding cassette, subfamily B, bacterial
VATADSSERDQPSSAPESGSWTDPDPDQVGAAGDPTMRKGGRRLVIDAIRLTGRWIPFGIVASMVWVAAKLLVPLAARAAVDHAFDPYDRGEVIKWSITLAVLAVLAGVGSWGRWIAAFRIAHGTEHELRSRLFAHVQRLHFGFHDRSQVGQLIARANNDLRQVNVLTVFIPVFTANIVMIVAILVVMVTIDPLLTLVAVSTFPLMWVAGRRFSARLDPVAASLQQRLADVSSVVEEGLAGIRVVKGFGAERQLSRRLGDRAELVRVDAVEMGRLRANFNPLLDLLPNAGIIAVLYMGGRQVIAENLTIGDLVAFNFLLLLLVFPIRLMSFIVAQLARANASAARVYEVMATAPAIVAPRHPTPLPEGPGLVELRDVDFAYEPALPPALIGLDLTIEAGTSLALVGPTGSGKSTIAAIIPRFYDVDSGAVRIDGVDVRELDLDELRRSVGLVFEETFLFTATVRDNIAFGKPDAPEVDVLRASRLARAHEFIEELPNGYETMVGEHGFSLSGGQRQRIAIARAVLADPRVLILDDATSAVDPTKEHEIRAALDEVMHGRTTLIIAHRAATVALADRVAVVDGGRVLAVGTHDHLIETLPRYREILARTEQPEAEIDAQGTDRAEDGEVDLR